MIAGTLEIQMMANMVHLVEGIKVAQQKVDAGMAAIQRSADMAGRALGGLAAAFSVAKVVAYADAWGQLSSRMAQATGSVQAGEAAMKRLMEVSNRVYKPIADTSELFIRTSESLKQMGYTTGQTVAMVETLSYGLTVSSASADKTKSVIDAWSKSLLQGKMTMGEYQTVISGAPALQKALADSLGVTIAGLQEMVGKGQLTAEKLMLITSQMQELGRQADAMPATVADAWTKLNNNLTAWAGKTNEATSATSLLVGALGILSANIDATVTALMTLVALGVANWLGVVGAAATAAGGGFTAAAIAVKGFIASFGAIGWIILGLGALATAWQVFGNKAKDAGAAAEGAASASEGAAQKMLSGLTPTIDALIKKYDDLITKQREALGLAPSTVSALNSEYEQVANKLRDAGKMLSDINTRSGKFAGMGGPELDRERNAALETLATLTRQQIELDGKAAEARKNAVAQYVQDTGRMTEAQRQAADLAKENARHQEALTLAEGDAAQTAQVNAAHQAALGEIRAKYNKAGVQASKQADESYRSLITSIQEKIAAEKLEMQTGEKLTEGEKMLIKLDAERASGKLKLTGVQYESVRAALGELTALEKQTQAQQEAIKVSQAAADARKKESDSIEDWMRSQQEAAAGALKSIKDRVQGLQEEEQATEMARSLNITLAEAIERVALARMKEKQAGFYKDSEGWKELQREIEEREKLIGLLGKKGVREREQRAWVDFFTSIDRTAHDVFVDVANNGMDAFKRVGQTIKAAVLDVLWQLVGRRWLIQIGTSFFGGNFAAAANSAVGAQGGGILGMASNASTLYNGYGMLSGGVGGNMGALSGLWGGTMSGANAAGSIFANTVASTGATDGLSALLMTNNAYGTGGAAGAASGAGWAAAGYAAVAALVLNALGAFKSDKPVGGGIRGTFGTGDISHYELWRQGGSLFSGPEYSINDRAREIRETEARLQALRDKGQGGTDEAYRLQQHAEALHRSYDEQIRGSQQMGKTLDDAFLAMRKNTLGMAEVLGISTDALKDWTTTVGTDLIHPDTGGLGIDLKDLDAEGVSKKIQEALATANNQLAEQLIGRWVTTTEERRRTNETLTPTYGDADIPGQWEEVTESITRTTYVASEYAKEGEKAIDTLTRLATSLSATNGMFEMLGMAMFDASLAGGDLASKLVDAFGGLENMGQAAGAFFQNFFSADEQREYARRMIANQLEALELAMPDINAIDARDQFRALAEAQDLTTESGRKAYAALLQLSGAFAQVTTSAEQAAEAAKRQAEEAARAAEQAKQAAIRSAYDMFRRAVDRDRSALQDQASLIGDAIDGISSAVEMLQDNVRDLYGTVDSTAQMLAAQGMVYIEQALGGVRAGGSLTDYDRLSEAIGAARSGIDGGAYATQFDRDRDTLVLAGQLSELGELGEVQLSVEERQLKAINAQIEYLDTLAKRADEMVNGTAALTGTVDYYFQQLMGLLGVKGGGATGPSYGGIQTGGSAGGGMGGAPAPAWQYGQGYLTDPQRFQTEYDFGRGRGSHDVVDPAQIAKLRDVRAMLMSEYGSGTAEDLQRVADKARGMGATQADIASALGYWLEDVRKEFAAVGIPAFASGGMHSGGLRVVGERGWELEATGPARIWNQQQLGQALGGQASARTEALLERLIDRVERLQSRMDEAAENTRVSAETQDDVTGGGNAMRAEIMNVSALAKAIAQEMA